MKELSIEEKARRYDEALEKARQLCAYPTSKPFISDLQDLFPELKGSEGEKIREELIDFVKSRLTGFPQCEKYITWLEKQGEHRQDTNYPKFDFDDVLALQCCMETVKKVQEDKDLYKKLEDLHDRVYDAYHFEKHGNNADKIEPKFMIGDWVVEPREGEPDGLWHIDRIEDGCYWSDKCGCTIENADKHWHLWTIEDAKDGDVLVHNSFMFDAFIFIYNNTSNLQAYCYYSKERNKFIIEDRGHYCPGNMQEVTPATKEQQDFLFQRMKETGYEWDADEKELIEL